MLRVLVVREVVLVQESLHLCVTGLEKVGVESVLSKALHCPSTDVGGNSEGLQ